ncbi:MAG: NBR1-Ig-like domain-containing protein [Anaerolineales bacterium]|nr:NBR1-Ig-like domain-containing protein [Anaerolineales bacterium]
MNKKIRLFNLLVAAALLISACNLPASGSAENIAGTAAAQTVQALLSATPIVTPSFTLAPVTPTLTPIPLPVNTNTPIATATSNCNVAQFITDVTIPDGSIMTPGQVFSKKWRIKNVGSCAWNGFSFVFDSGDAMGGAASSAIAALNPGQEVDLSIDLTAPSTPGTYRGYWRITTNASVLVPIVNGAQGGRSFYVDIKVQNAVTTTPVTPTATNTSPAPVFAVTGVSFTNSGVCGGFTATASVTANGAGSVTYHFVRSDGAIDGAAHAPIVFASAGTQLAESYTWTVTAPGTYWIDIYIDTPNHQQFGRASFTCP